MSRLSIFMWRGVVLLLCFWSIGLSPQSVRAEEYIESYTVNATLDTQRRLEVTETIDYNFGTTPRHGIFRQIPLTYARGSGMYRLPITVLEAMMDGKPVPLKETRENGELTIRLGDEKILITGRHLYTIQYATDRAITDWSDHQELYWNVNGNGWTVLAKKMSFALQGPGPVRSAVCYTGPKGSTEHACAVTVASSTATFVATKSFGAGEGFTIAVAFPPGTMRSLPWWRILWYWLWEHPFVILPFFTFVLMFLLWWVHGRDPIGRGTVIPQYEEPRGLPPALLSALLHQSISVREASATILDLARRGYLVLTPPASGDKKGSWTITRTEKSIQSLLPFEQTLLKGLASPGETLPLSQSSGTYSAVFLNFNKQLTAELVSHQWFHADPGQARGCWFLIAFAIAFASIIAAEAMGIELFFGALLSAVIVAVFGWFMPKTTKEGAVLSEEVEGLKHFLSVTEKERLAFHDAPERRPEEFSRLLAVAVALGVEQKWAKQFEHLLIPTPEYIHSSSSTWSSLALADHVEHLHTAFSRGVASSSSSSGGSGFSGGSSGGGFGGGGGGSW